MTTISRMAGAFAVALALAGGTAIWAGGRQGVAPPNPELPKPAIRGGSGEVLADHLKGLKGANVLIEALDKDAAAIGLTEGHLRTATELALRRKGVRVLTQEESLATRGAPYLYVQVNVVGAGFFAGVQLNEAVRLERNPRIQVADAAVWGKSSAGTHGGNPDFIAKTVEQLVEMFGDVYLKANPKK